MPCDCMMYMKYILDRAFQSGCAPVKPREVNDRTLDGGVEVLEHDREGGSFPSHSNVVFISQDHVFNPQRISG
ncbi:hypothetical protein DSO57_1003780 [Entomophthora muscae]|uniref:Uncharacterized protein n=1 Tax=Entomophthora muscae TaxID=34485 RepID=A0ACC2TJ27_9FUNG|nr:hypothetical protein DSO57_1003780 [Entomophthora muscae]